MEFSFDRSKQSNQQSQQSQNNNMGNDDQSGQADSSQVSNERLKKAIERNRARQAERERMTMRAPSSESNSAWAQHQMASGVADPRENMQPASPALSGKETSSVETERKVIREPMRTRTIFKAPTQDQNYSQESLFDKPSEHGQTAVVEEEVQSTPNETKVEREETPKVQIRSMARDLPTRRSVAKPEETEFTPVKRTSRKAASHISYTTGQKKRSREVESKYVDYLAKGTWLFCGFLVLRLIFASGGVTDYFSQRTSLNDRWQELARIKKENMSLVHEIERMQFDVAFQKRLVRDNLGFIAEDEFLILFPKD